MMNFSKKTVGSVVVLTTLCAFLLSPLACLSANQSEAEIPLAIDSRIRTLIYSPNQVYELSVGHGLQSYIEFSKGEKVMVLALGDSASWKVQQTDRRIFIRPMVREGRTNMVVITNKYSYTFDMVARSPESEDIVYIARFYHPESGDGLDKTGYKDAIHQTHSDSVGGFSREDLEDSKSFAPIGRHEKVNHEYAVQGDEGIKPVEVFDNNKVVFIKFPTGSGILPRVYKVNKDLSETALDMFEYHGYIIVNGLHDRLSLRYKDKMVELRNRRI